MTLPPRATALLGPDVILLAMERLAGSGAASGNAVLAVELGGSLPRERVERALARFLPLCPWLGGRLARPLPWGKLFWRVPARGPTPPPLLSTSLAADGVPGLVDRELANRLDPWREPPLRVTVASGDAGAALILTWAHPLMDPRGSEYLLRLLADLDDHPDDATPWPRPPLLTAPGDAGAWRERGALASRGAAQLRELAPEPPLSLAAARPDRRSTVPRHRRFRFSAEPAVDRMKASVPWRLAVVAKAMTAIWMRRGLGTNVPFLVPVSVDRRRRGEPGPVLGNYLAFHFARCPAPVDGDTAALARKLRADLAEAVRRDDLEAAWAGMSFARYRPLRGMFRELPWAASGDFCSFHFADTGPLLPERTDVFGVPVIGGYHVAGVPPRPGAGVFFTRAGTTENVVVSWSGDVLDDADADEIAGIVQREMSWTPV